MLSKNIKKLIDKLPDAPGVYQFKRGKEILYIGKATSLRDRVRSYFNVDIVELRGPLILKMLQDFKKIDFIKTDSVLEALVLEAFLIKKFQPKYNTKEKSDKSFNYVCITDEELPKVILVRGKELVNKKFNDIFGPFTSGTQLKEGLKLIRKIFPYLDDKSKNYLEFYKQINLVPDLEDKKLYLQNIKNIKLFFSGKKKQILNNLKREMKVYARGREFEKAGEIKRQIFALQHINDVALLKESSRTRNIFSSGYPAKATSPFRKDISSSATRIEAYDVAHMAGRNMVGVMTVVVDGEVNKAEYKKFKIKTIHNTLARRGGDDTGALKEVLERRLKHTEWIFPSFIVVDGGKAQINTARKVLVDMNLDIPVVSVLKDDRHKPKAIMGDKVLGVKYESEILLANNEAHRFAINYHKNMRNKNFLK